MKRWAMSISSGCVLYWGFLGCCCYLKLRLGTEIKKNNLLKYATKFKGRLKTNVSGFRRPFLQRCKSRIEKTVKRIQDSKPQICWTIVDSNTNKPSHELPFLHRYFHFSLPSPDFLDNATTLLQIVF